jgi:hypothetical protein
MKSKRMYQIYMEMPLLSSSTLQAGIDFRWEWIARYYMRVRKSIPFATIEGDTVGPPTLIGYGYIIAELPNPEVHPEQRIVCLKSSTKATLNPSRTLIWTVALSLVPMS